MSQAVSAWQAVIRPSMFQAFMGGEVADWIVPHGKLVVLLCFISENCNGGRGMSVCNVLRAGNSIADVVSKLAQRDDFAIQPLARLNNNLVMLMRADTDDDIS
ncbi:hypothetical protein V6N13_140513 [Hibiscus sabdariffa]|uniref:Uncharacterized protein n=2 Tax=Hibiscus sabdariffa TaxID=183260 RepID=A0ABR2Q2Q0_9ROSI